MWNREPILNRTKQYYENDKERLREGANNRYRKISEEENMEEIDIIVCLKKKNKN